MKEMLKKIDNKWIRLIALIIVFVNASLQMFDINFLPFSGEQIIYGVSIAGIIIVGTWNYWKNNSFTDLAKEADHWLEGMKQKIKNQKNMFKNK